MQAHARAALLYLESLARALEEPKQPEPRKRLTE
jgi:hypothetical protein